MTGNIVSFCMFLVSLSKRTQYYIICAFTNPLHSNWTFEFLG